MTSAPMLFQPIQIRDMTLKNRVVIAPMCQYTAVDGLLNDWHFVHLTQFAMGGAGLIIVEATGVEKRGRITYGCSGIWSDAHIPPLKRMVESAHRHGAKIGLQLAHAGRKASIQRPWEGDAPLTEREFAKGETPWEIVAPSAVPFGPGWLTPHALTIAEIGDMIDAWVKAAKRAEQAGFDMIEIHSAHGYLSHSFLSPLSNRRTDKYGGSRENRMRFTLELAEAVRAAWPASKPCFLRISSVDGLEGGWAIEDTVALAIQLKRIGIDVIDCSSGGIAGEGKVTLPKSTPGYQVGFAAQVRREADIKTQAVGLILHATQAETILRSGAADLVALAREALHDPYWALHAAEALSEDADYKGWPIQYGHWLGYRAKGLFGGRPGSSDTDKAKTLGMAQR
ncbi:MAG: NADH:flavin oxidoreductase/NADH oxidase [Alphaproteobacteria bacterium]|nr:NADH:flavin oxidoreductase/NADH oxidase [Alphaproteobacteria bacterium]